MIRVVTLAGRTKEEVTCLSWPGRVITGLVVPVIRVSWANHACNDPREERKREKETTSAGHSLSHGCDQADPRQHLFRHGRDELTGSHSPVKHGRNKALHTDHIA